MPQISNLSFNVSFEPHNPNRVGLTNTTPSLPAGFVGIFKVTQPDGYVRNGDINTPDVTNVVSSCVVTLVPDSAGQLQQGQYIIELIGNAPGYLSTSFIRTFTLQYTAATISLRNDFDVFTPQLAYTDISNYNVSGYTISSGPTRKWDATSATTGTISGTNSSIDIKYNNQYYAENYTIQFEVNVAYVSQAYPWLTITHTRTQSTTVTACIPKSLEDLTQAVEALREESNASCGGDWAKFEKANALYAHLLNMLRLVLIAGQHQDGFFDVYQQLLTYIQNGSVACDSIGQVIPPYDFSDYESSIYDGQSSYCQLVGDGVNTVYRVNHQLGDQCVVVQVYEVATGKQVFCDLAVSTINSIDITFYEPPTLNQYRVVAVAGALGLRGQGFQPGGLTGQILRKKTNADFDTEWADVAVALPLLVPYTGATQSVYLGEHGIEAGFVRLDTTPTGIPATPAVMSWNDTDGTAELRLKGNNVTLQVGQEMVARVVNKTGANLLGSQYKAVRVRKVSEGGAQGQRLAVVLAQANTEFLSTDMLGVVTENIDNNQEGFITTFGAIKNIDTTGALQGEVWADGDILFLSPTVPGGLTKVKPSAPNHLSIVGYVEYAHQNNGKIFVHVQTSWELDELHNVSISNPVANQTLVYNSGTGLWENSKLSLHALSNVFVSSPQAGQALVYTGGGWQNQALPPSGVTSVGLATATSGVTITDTPVTGSGVININIATASASSNGLLSSVDWATFNAKQSAITLTTTGNSGAATFVGSTLNIPNYTLSGLGGVPTTRSLTINGTAYDLSADRTWSVGTVTSVAALTIGTAGADISSTVATGTTTPVITLNVPTASASARGVLTSSDWTAFNSKISGSGTVNYLSKFTAGGTIGSSQVFDNGTFVGIGTNTPSDILHLKGILGGDVYLNIENPAYSNSIKVGNVNGGGHISVSGFNPISFYTNGVDRLRIGADGNIGIGTTIPNARVEILGGDARVSRIVESASIFRGYQIASGSTEFASLKAEASFGELRLTSGAAGIGGFTTMYTTGTERLRISSAGVITVANLAGSGARVVVADASGNLSATTLSSSVTTGSGTTNYITKWTGASTQGDSQIFDNGTSVGIGTASPSAKLQIGNGSGLQQGYISGGGYDLVLGASGGSFLGVASQGITTIFNTSATPLGIGTNGSQPLLLGTGNLERLRITSTGDVGIGTTSPAQKLDVAGNMQITGGGNWLRYDAYGYFGSGSVAGGTTTDVAVRSENSIYFSTGGATEKMRLSTTGELIIGGASDAGDYKLQVSGNIYNTGSAVLATNGTSHIGMGVVPSAWSWPNGVTQFRFGGHIAVADNSFLQLGTNSYYDGSNYVRVNAGYASRYLQNDGGHFWSTAITSTAGSTVTFNEQMRMTRDGELLINTTTDVGDYKLQVAGNIYGSGLAVIGNAIINTNSPFVTGANIYTNGQSLALGTQGANLMSFFTNNTERLRITSGGNVGIGDASPTDLLVVNGRMRVNGTNRITFGNNSGGYAGIGVTGATTGNLTFNTFDGTSDGERLRIFANGRVGINTTTDAGYQLDVNGDVRFQGTLYTRSGTNTGIVMASTSAIRNTGTQYFDYGTGGSGDFYFRGGSGFANVLTLMNGGNVGIGTASPANKLSINGAANALTYFLVDNSQTYLGDNGVIGGGAADGNTALSWFSTKDLYFKEGSSTRMTIKSGGELLINTTTDAGDYKLQVAGNILTNVIYTRNNTDALIFGTNSAVNPYIQGTSGNALVLGTSNNPRIWITSDGNVGVGTTSPTQRLDVSGYVIAGVTDRTLIGQDGTYTGYSTVGFGGVGNGSNRVFGSSSSADGLYLAAATGRGITFRVNGTDIASMFINSLGNVGIGTTSPTSKLDVLDGDISVNTLNTFSFLNTNRNTIPSGAGTSLGGLRYRAYSTGTTYQVGAQILSFSSAAWSSTSSPSYLSFQTTPSGSVTPSERMVIDASGNVGVGIASALYKMHVYNTSGESSLFLESGTTTQAALYLANANNAIFNDNSTTNNLKFFVNSATRMTINSAGELLINTTTDAGDYKLQVSGNALVTAGKLDITTNTAFGLGIQRSGTSVVAGQINNSNGILYYGAESSTGGSLFTGSSAYAAVIGSGAAYPLEFATNNIVRASISSAGVAKINDLAGSGTRMVVADSSGVLSTQAIPSGGGGSSTLSFNRQTASYTIVSGDVGKVVEMNVGTANNATIPTNATASIAVGSQITIAQYGSGQTTIVAAAGVTLRATNNWLKISAQYGAATLVKVATDEWYVVGNLSA